MLFFLWLSCHPHLFLLFVSACFVVASCIDASCIDASSVGVVDQPQQDVGGGSVVEQLVELVAGALNIVAVVDHLAVAVEAFSALVVAALVVVASVVFSLVVAASKIVETPHQIKRWLGRWLVAWLGR